MEDGALIAIGVGAVLVVYFVTKAQEQKTAAMILAAKQQQQQQAKKSGEPYAVSFNDALAVGATVVATYFGGPSSGAKAAAAFSA